KKKNCLNARSWVRDSSRYRIAGRLAHGKQPGKRSCLHARISPPKSNSKSGRLLDEATSCLDRSTVYGNYLATLMGLAERRALIEAIEKKRGSEAIAYVTGRMNQASRILFLVVMGGLEVFACAAVPEWHQESGFRWAELN